ncbi:hypothetical protein AABB24_023621, partial [Solanum stoloniferum]
DIWFPPKTQFHLFYFSQDFSLFSHYVICFPCKIDAFHHFKSVLLQCWSDSSSVKLMYFITSNRFFFNVGRIALRHYLCTGTSLKTLIIFLFVLQSSEADGRQDLISLFD